MAKNRVIVENKFQAVKKAGWETVQEAREVWMNIGAKTAQDRADSQAATRGYNLSIGIGKERVGFQSARIFVVGHSQRWGDDPFWARFFEYGTSTIAAMPFIRPGASKANKVFVAYMGQALEGKIRRKASVRRR